MERESLLQLKCSSPLAPYMEALVEQRRAVGQKYNGGVEVFNIFDRFCLEHGLNEPVLTDELLNLWENRRTAECQSTQYQRVTYVRTLAKYMANHGAQAPSQFHAFPYTPNKYEPYVFTKDEISRLFAAVDTNSPPVPYSLRHLVMPVLFRLLYSCGLRITEALRLKTDKVDLEQGVLIVENAKGGKDRMVGLSDSMLHIMRAYRSSDEVRTFQSEYFFPAPDGGFYDSSTIYAYFRRYLYASGIPHRGRGKGPRLHDLRHTFSVHVLNKWSAEGRDLYNCLPILCTYLGHDRMRTTEQYLRLVPEAYGHITDKFEEKFKHIYPEVPLDETP